MVNALNDMPASTNQISGSKGIGVLVGNSMMFQRFPTHGSYEDPQLSNFYGMVLPLLKRGIPVETVHMENLGFAGTLKNIKVLVMSYTNMKPQAAVINEQLAERVKKGGMLIYYGTDSDPFQTVKEWWNTNGKTYAGPSSHLFELLHISPSTNKTYTYGKGKITVVKEDPKQLVLEPNMDSDSVGYVKKDYEAIAGNGKLQFKNYFYLERGPYDIASVMDEGVSTEPLHIKGLVIDMFDPLLPVLKEKILDTGKQTLLYDLNRVIDKKMPKVLCAASRVYNEKRTSNTYSFNTKSPSNTNNVMRVLLPAKPVSVITKDAKGKKIENINTWD